MVYVAPLLLLPFSCKSSCGRGPRWGDTGQAKRDHVRWQRCKATVEGVVKGSGNLLKPDDDIIMCYGGNFTCGNYKILLDVVSS